MIDKRQLPYTFLQSSSTVVPEVMYKDKQFCVKSRWFFDLLKMIFEKDMKEGVGVGVGVDAGVGVAIV